MLEHLTATRARALLDRHGLAARRRLGQHFLVDPNTVRRIVRLAGVGPGDRVLEVGPGLGSLTAGLAEVGAHVIALEVDTKVAAVLAEVVGDVPDVEVILGDALDVDLRSLAAPAARLVSNLPYNLATPIMARVLDEVPEVAGGLVMVQRELGERWTAPPGSKTYGAISVKVAYHARARIAGEVSKHVFLPPPEVTSVLVAFERRTEPPVRVGDARGFLDFVAAAFGHRRKNLLNSLTAAGYDRRRSEEALSAAAIPSTDRPERIDLEGFAGLYRALSGGGA